MMFYTWIIDSDWLSGYQTIRSAKNNMQQVQRTRKMFSIVER